MVLSWLSLVLIFFGLIGIYMFNTFALKGIIRDIAHNTRYFCKIYDKLTNEAIKNITWKEHDRLVWIVTGTWMLSMILGALFAIVLYTLTTF